MKNATTVHKLHSFYFKIKVFTVITDKFTFFWGERVGGGVCQLKNVRL